MVSCEQHLLYDFMHKLNAILIIVLWTSKVVLENKPLNEEQHSSPVK